MKIKSKHYWDLQEELGTLRARIESDQDIIGDLRRGQQEWRAKFEALLAGGVDEKLEREKAFERGRQHGVLSLRGYLMDALNRLASDPPQPPASAPMTQVDVEGAVH